MKEGRQKINLGWSILLIYFCRSKMVGWARMCHIVPFCLALDNPKVESAKSNPEDPVALDQTLCFRARKRNGLYLFSPLLAAVPVKLQDLCISSQTSSPCACVFCLYANALHACWSTEYPMVLRSWLMPPEQFRTFVFADYVTVSWHGLE